MKPIGLMGFKGVGKSTAADSLIAQGYTLVPFKKALVDEMKQNLPDLLQEIAKLYTVSTDKLKAIDWLFDEKPPLMRALMQNYGKFRYDQDPEFILRAWLETYDEVPGGVVADDVRRINEANAIRSKGGILILLKRPDITTGGDHITETEHLQITPDYIVTVKKGEQDKLDAEIKRILAELK